MINSKFKFKPSEVNKLNWDIYLKYLKNNRE